MSVPEVRVLDDPVDACAAEMLAVARANPRAHIVLTGGSTPIPAYRIAAADADVFDAVTFWFGDERCVAPDDERSNYGMAKQTLLDPLAAAGSHCTCHRMQAEGGPAVAALDYERVLQDVWPNGTLAFDLVLVGIGPDAHVLSLFPGQPSVTEHERLVVGVPEAGLQPFVPRVSFTLRALRDAARVVVLASGAGKADAIARAFAAGAVPTASAPASLLADAVAPGALTVLLDAAAAARL